VNVCAKCGYGWAVPYTGFAEAELLKQEHERNLLFDRQRQRNKDLRARLALAEKVIEAAKLLRDKYEGIWGSYLVALDAALSNYDKKDPP
jgi:hypothetical protein